MLLFGHRWDERSGGLNEWGRNSQRERSNELLPSLPRARNGPPLFGRPSSARLSGVRGRPREAPLRRGGGRDSHRPYEAEGFERISRERALAELSYWPPSHQQCVS